MDDIFDFEESFASSQILHFLNGGEYKCIDSATSLPGFPILVGNNRTSEKMAIALLAYFEYDRERVAQTLTL